jgi:hypothetical protein
MLNQMEPYKSIMLYVRSVILKTLPEVTERYSYNIPFYNIGKKPMLYLNILKGTDYVDVAFVHGILLENEFPFWNQLNGPIADALWHCGQVISFRRSSGNPYNSKASVFSGKVRE